MLFLFCLSLGLLVYVYVGYPVLLRLLVWVRGEKRFAAADITPRVSLVISAYNEAPVIRAKLANALSQDYPRDLLQIVVVSDASDDGTDEIVREHARDGVVLRRQDERRGKTAGLNAVVPHLTGDIVIFSDANAMYEPDAVRRLVRGFADAAVGAVVGEARYLKGSRTAAGVGERAYWGYEIRLKRCETSLGSMVGGDGAIYGIRRALWKTLPENAINDFLNPLQIVAAGWRVVYEPHAVCYEEAAGDVRREWKRRVRIVGRSWRAIFQVPQLLNPLRYGLFTFCLVSHKVLRWLSALFIAGAIVGAAGVAALRPELGIAAAVVGVLLLVAALIPAGRRAVGFVAYFIAINAASLVGVWRGTFGRVSGIWTTPRAEERSAGMLVYPGPVVLGGMALAVIAALAVVLGPWGTAAERAVFFVSAGVIAYVYVAYPLLLAVVGKLRRDVTRESSRRRCACSSPPTTKRR